MQIKYESLFKTNDKTIYRTYLYNSPDCCPMCNRTQEPKFVLAYETQPAYIEVVFKCTSHKCGKLFIGETIRIGDNGYGIKRCHPIKPFSVNFNKEIGELSPLFVEIFNQANAAEAYNLNHVAGMGYRKSLEFLIKDYLINFKNEDEETIKKTFLGNCIKNYLSDNIKRVAELATWLGNDETHYHRVWEDKDIEDLKTLIELTHYWITSEIQTARYIEEMVKVK